MKSETIVLVFSERALISQGKSFGCLQSVVSLIDSQQHTPLPDEHLVKCGGRGDALPCRVNCLADVERGDDARSREPDA